MKLHFFDSPLIDKRGHNYEYAKSICDEWRRCGYDATVYAHQRVEPEIAESLGAVPLFSRGNFCQLPLDLKITKLNHLVNFPLKNLRFFRELRNVAPSRFSRDDVILFPCIDYNQLFATLLWYRLLPEKHKPLLVLLFRYSNVECRPERHMTKHALLYRLSFKLFAGMLAGSSIVLTTDSDILAEEYEEISGQRITVMPIPHMPEHALPEHACGRDEVVLLNLGDAREEKGYHLLPAAVESVLRQRGDVRFVIQTILSEHTTEAVFQAKERLAAYPDRVTIIDRKLDSKEYYDALLAADAVLVPYNPSAYFGRSSGIFSEAVACGKPVITTAGTWMERQLRQYDNCGVVFDSFDSAGLARGIMQYLEHKRAVDDNACRARQRWNAFHNAPKFVAMLLEMKSKRTD